MQEFLAIKQALGEGTGKALDHSRRAGDEIKEFVIGLPEALSQQR
jgi:hypothetical protein